MVKLSDLDRINRLRTQRAQDVAMRDRLQSGEPLKIMIGDDKAASLIVVAPGYTDGIRKDLLGSFAGRISEVEDQLMAAGVEL
ncbi:hypothetical protein [Tianweitania sediminis]|uniref:Uncharacterized protein n=1 Tax=Tianweitania sediminis TaxID=1502156 RepID=A0A8J7R1F9_9HYPH|nr:hypothetical protein [Tianweitania sediminis]MBP0438451.1 hypothetical protein [Tianweitania sediminis]